MKKIFLAVFALTLLGGIYAFTTTNNEEAIAVSEPVAKRDATQIESVENVAEGELKWYSWEEAVAACEKEPRKIFVDVYTDWCGWCKVMDKKTFPIPAVKSYIEENFYPVKLDAEQKEDIVWNGNTFSWRPAGRNGINMLAYSLLEGKTSYPTIVYLNEKFERIMISPGYKTPEQFLPELKFAAEEHYTSMTWEEYKKGK
jgi:thioredoxin-related protein